MRRRDERGETLAEILVSTTLLGIIGIGIIGAIASVLISTDIDRRISAGETVLRSYVAAIQDAPYQPCDAGTPDYDPGAVGFGAPQLPANFTANVVGVQYWDGVGPTVVPKAAATLSFGVCPADGDLGLQRVDVEVKSTGSRPTTEHVTIYKRRTTAVAP